jgi:hypothetical protein
MKNLLLLSTLTLSLMFSSGSWAEWTEVSMDAAFRDKAYVDFESIRKVNGMVYYWRLRDLLEPSELGTMSTKLYFKADCETMRESTLSFTTYKLPMAEGDGETLSPYPDPQWKYHQPDTPGEIILLAVCAH